MRSSLWGVSAVRAGVAGSMMFALAALFVQVHVALIVGVLGYAGSCALAALMLPVRYAVLTGLSGWAFLTGFVVNVGGRLTLGRGDLEHLALLLALSFTVSVLVPGHGSRV